MQVIIHTRHAVNMKQSERWFSAAAGSALVVVGLADLARKSKGGLGMALAGAELLRRGITGHSLLYEYLGMRKTGWGQGAETTSVPYELGVRVDDATTIQKPRDEVYRFWRNLSNLPRFASHIVSVEQVDRQRSRWVVHGPAGRRVKWDAEINYEVENERIAFRSLPGSEVELAGAVRFKDAPGGGTEVIVELQYNPPGGVLGAFAARMWGEEPSQQICDDLERIRHAIEADETDAAKVPGGARAGVDKVEEASEESFPASDAPAWM